MYFARTDDFSCERFLKSLWRLNLLSIVLSLTTGTPWIAYYVCALHTTHFVLCFIALFLARSNVPYIRECLMLRELSTEDVAQTKVEMLAGAGALLFIFSAYVWDFPYVYDEKIAPTVAYLFGNEFSTHFEYRTRLDHFSSAVGILSAVFMLSPPGYLASAFEKHPKRTKGLLVTGALFLLLTWRGVFVLATANMSAQDPLGMAAYSRVHPYVSVFVWPAYLLLRGAHERLRTTVSVPLEYVGTRSLEFYLLQFHMFLGDGAKGLLTFVPGGKLLNFGLALGLYVFGASRAFQLTQDLMRSAFAAGFEMRIAWVLSLCAGPLIAANGAKGNLSWFQMWVLGGVTAALIKYLPWFMQALDRIGDHLGENPRSRLRKGVLEELSRADERSGLVTEDGGPSYGTNEASEKDVAKRVSKALPIRSIDPLGDQGHLLPSLFGVKAHMIIRAPLLALLLIMLVGNGMIFYGMWLETKCIKEPQCVNLREGGWVSERFDVFDESWLCDAAPWTWQNTPHSCSASFGSAKVGINPWIDPVTYELSTFNESAAHFHGDCMATSSPNAPGWRDVKPWLRYNPCGREGVAESAPERLLALMRALPRRHIVFHGDSIGRQFFKGTVSALIQIPGVSFSLLPPILSNSAIKYRKTGRLAESTPGVRMSFADDPSGSYNVVIEFAWMERYDAETIPSVVKDQNPDMIIVNMGHHYPKQSDFNEAVRGLRNDIDQFDVPPQPGGYRTRILMSEIMPFGMCDPETALKGVRCVCVHTSAADDHIRSENAYAYEVLGREKVIYGIYADYYGRMDAYMGPAGWNGLDCLHMRAIDGLYEPMMARLVEAWPKE